MKLRRTFLLFCFSVPIIPDSKLNAFRIPLSQHIARHLHDIVMDTLKIQGFPRKIQIRCCFNNTSGGEETIKRIWKKGPWITLASQGTRNPNHIDVVINSTILFKVLFNVASQARDISRNPDRRPRFTPLLVGVINSEAATMMVVYVSV